MRLLINTSYRSASLKRVASDIARVAHACGFPEVEVAHSVSPTDPRLGDCSHVLTVMVFDPTIAVSYFYFTWLAKRKGKNTIFYTTVEGKPRVGIWADWIRRDLEFVACSEYVAEKLREAGVRVKAVVHHGVDLEAFRFSPEKRSAFREALGLTDEDFLVGYVAGWYKRKGHALFAEVIKMVVEEDPSVKFLIVTSEKSAAAYMDAPNTTVLTSFGSSGFDITSVYSAIDLYCHPSLSEGFGLPVVEALAAGRPVVHPDYKPLSEITTPNTSVRVGVKEVKMEEEGPGLMSGILYEMKYYDLRSMAKAILEAKERLLSDEGKAWREKCVKRARKFDMRNTYKQLLTLF